MLKAKTGHEAGQVEGGTVRHTTLSTHATKTGDTVTQKTEASATTETKKSRGVPIEKVRRVSATES